MDARQSHSASDGRRRRRIIQKTDDLIAEFDELIPGRTRSRKTEPAPLDTAPSNHRILTKLISGRLWKHGLLILGMIALAACAVWLESRPQPAMQIAETSGRPRFTTGLAAVYLLLAGQLALLVAWIRSESTLDFSGRYRWWKWLSVLLIGIGGLWIANVQDALPLFAGAIAEPILGAISATRRTLVVVPAAAITLLVLSRVIPDMSRNRLAQVLFMSAVLAACARTVLASGWSVGPLPVSLPNGILLSSATLLICSLMLHARYVLYICNDPPAALRRLPAAAAASSAVNDGNDVALKPVAANQPAEATSSESPDTPDCVPLPTRAQSAAKESASSASSKRRSTAARKKETKSISSSAPSRGKRKARRAA